MSKARDLKQRRTLTPAEIAEQDQRLADQVERDLRTPDLLRRIRAGEPIKADRRYRAFADARAAAGELVELHSKLVWKQVAHYRDGRCSVVDADDLYQAGAMGLLRAAQLFDPTKGVKFSSYSVPAIRRHIERELANTSRAVRIPVHEASKLGALHRAQDEIAAEGGTVTDAEIARRSNLPTDTVARLVLVEYQTGSMQSLDAPADTSYASSLGRMVWGDSDFAAPNNVAAVADPSGPESQWETNLIEDADLGALLDVLSGDERDVIELRWLQGMTQDATRIELQRRASGVKELEASALVKLRAAGADQLTELLAA